MTSALPMQYSPYWGVSPTGGWSCCKFVIYLLMMKINANICLHIFPSPSNTRFVLTCIFTICGYTSLPLAKLTYIVLCSTGQYSEDFVVPYISHCWNSPYPREEKNFVHVQAFCSAPPEGLTRWIREHMGLLHPRCDLFTAKNYQWWNTIQETAQATES